MPEPLDKTPEQGFSDTPSGLVDRRRFTSFRESGWGQFAEALWLLSKEHPKKFWVAFFVAAWMFVNGMNNLGELIKVAHQTGDFLKILNPFAAGQ